MQISQKLVVTPQNMARRNTIESLFEVALGPLEKFEPGEAGPSGPAKVSAPPTPPQPPYSGGPATGLRTAAKVVAGSLMGALGLVGLLLVNGCTENKPIDVNSPPAVLVQKMEHGGDFQNCRQVSSLTLGSFIFHEKSVSTECDNVSADDALKRLQSGEGVHYSGKSQRTFLENLQDARNQVALMQDGKGTSYGDGVVDAAARFRNNTYRDQLGKFQYSALKSPLDLLRNLEKGNSEPFFTPSGRGVRIQGLDGLKKADALYGTNASGLTLSEAQKKDLLDIENLKFPNRKFAVDTSAIEIWTALESGQPAILEVYSKGRSQVEIGSWEQLHEAIGRIANQGLVDQYRRPDLQQSFDQGMGELEAQVASLAKAAKVLEASTRKLPDSLQSEQMVTKDGVSQLAQVTTPNKDKVAILESLSRLAPQLSQAPEIAARAREQFATARQNSEARKVQGEVAVLPDLYKTGLDQLPGKPLESQIRGYYQALKGVSRLYQEFEYPQAPADFKPPADTLEGWQPGAPK